MGLIRLEPSLECGGGGSAAQNSGFMCPMSFPGPHPLGARHSSPARWLFFGGKAQIRSVLAAGEAEPGWLLALLPREAAGAAGAEDPAVGLSASLTIKEAELFITLMAGLTLPGSFSFSGLVFVCIWKASSPVLCTVCPLARWWTEEETASLPLGTGGGLSPAPHGRAASPDASKAGEGWKRALFVL